MAKESGEGIGRELHDAMKNLEGAVSDSWQYVNEIGENASRGIKDMKPVHDLYAHLALTSSYQAKLYDLTRKYVEQIESGNKSDS